MSQAYYDGSSEDGLTKVELPAAPAESSQAEEGGYAFQGYSIESNDKIALMPIPKPLQNG